MFPQVNGDISQANDNQYTGVLSIQHERRKMNTLTVIYNNAGTSRDISANLQLYNRRNISAGFFYDHPSNTAHQMNSRFAHYDSTSFSSQLFVNINKTNPMGTLSFAFGHNNYSLAIQGENEPSYRSMMTDVRYPNRRIIVETAAGKRDNTYQVRLL